MPHTRITLDADDRANLNAYLDGPGDPHVAIHVKGLALSIWPDALDAVESLAQRLQEGVNTMRAKLADGEESTSQDGVA